MRCKAVILGLCMVGMFCCSAGAEDLEINTKEELADFRDSVNSGKSYVGDTVTLSLSVDISDIEWTPIGNPDNPFSGIFDGCNNTVSGMTVSAESMKDYAGLFGYNNGTIKNLTVNAVKCEANSDSTHVYSGAIAAYSTGTILNCAASGVIYGQSTKSYIYAGGICGFSTGSINGASSNASVTSYSNTSWEYQYPDAYSGGIAGGNRGIIADAVYTGASCYANSRFASAAAGGIAADNKGSIAGCTASGNIESLVNFGVKMTYGYAGGIAGSNTGNIENSTSSAAVKAKSEGDPEQKRYISVDAGGLCGYNSGTVASCSASGEVSGYVNYSKGESNVGGFCGYNIGILNNSYSTGRITATSNTAGGLCGINKGVISGSYSTGSIAVATETEKIKYAGGIAGKNINGKIYFSYSKSIILTGNEIIVGGLTGDNDGGNISDCYYLGTMLKGSECGGLCGTSSGTVANSYARTSIYSTALIRGGAVGTNSGVVKECFYSVTNAADDGGGTRKTDTELKSSDTYNSWTFDNFWCIDGTNSGYPHFKDDISQPIFSGGNGESESPYIISDAKDLFNMRYMPEASYRIVNNIELSSEWMPIGTCCADAFSGTVDGGGHTVSGINISRGNYVGLFGYLKNASVKNVNVCGAITLLGDKNTYAGGIAGYSEKSEIINCSYNGTVDVCGGYVYAGGISGYADGTIGACKSSGNVTAATALTESALNAGGIAGAMNGNIYSCKSDMLISQSNTSGDEYAVENSGGIAGSAVGDIADSCFSGKITTDLTSTGSFSGGIAGRINGSIKNSYSSSEISGAEQLGGASGALYNGDGNTAYYVGIPNITNRTGTEIAVQRLNEDSFLQQLLTDESADSGYFWVKDKLDGVPVPLDVKNGRRLEDGFTKCFIEANANVSIYYTDDGSNPLTDGKLYTKAFLCDDTAKVRYYVTDGVNSSGEFTFVSKPESKYPLIFTAEPLNQDNVKINAENVASTTKILLGFRSEIEKDIQLFAVFYDSFGNIKSSVGKNFSLAKGENDVVFEDITAEACSYIRLFAWDDRLRPYSEPLRF